MRKYFVVYVSFSDGNSGYFYDIYRDKINCQDDIKHARRFPGKKPAEMAARAIRDQFEHDVVDVGVYEEED